MLHPLQTAQLASERRTALQVEAGRRRSARVVRGEPRATVLIGRLAATAGGVSRSAHTRVARAVMGSAGSQGR